MRMGEDIVAVDATIELIAVLKAGVRALGGTEEDEEAALTYVRLLAAPRGSDSLRPLCAPRFIAQGPALPGVQPSRGSRHGSLYPLSEKDIAFGSTAAVLNCMQI